MEVVLSVRHTSMLIYKLHTMKTTNMQKRLQICFLIFKAKLFMLLCAILAAGTKENLLTPHASRSTFHELEDLVEPTGNAIVSDSAFVTIKALDKILASQEI